MNLWGWYYYDWPQLPDAKTEAQREREHSSEGKQDLDYTVDHKFELLSSLSLSLSSFFSPHPYFSHGLPISEWNVTGP